MIDNTNDDLFKFYVDVRSDLLLLLHKAQSGHPGGALSSLHYLCFLAYNKKIDIYNDLTSNKCPFFLSPGHYCPGLYVLMRKLGIIEENSLDNFRTIHCVYHGHPIRNPNSRIFYTSGSLGQGLSIALGVAISNPQSFVHVLISDGELNEGQIWEAIFFLSSSKISNIIIAVDLNGFQLDGSTSDILSIPNLGPILSSLGCEVATCNGNDFQEIANTYSQLSSSRKPKFLLLNTTIGFGCPEIEGSCVAHGAKITTEMISSNV